MLIECMELHNSRTRKAARTGLAGQLRVAMQPNCTLSLVNFITRPNSKIIPCSPIRSALIHELLHDPLHCVAPHCLIYHNIVDSPMVGVFDT